MDIGNQAAVKGKRQYPRGKSAVFTAKLSPFSHMTICSDEESFYASGNTDTYTLDPLGILNCYRVLPSYRYRYLIAANDDPIYYEESAFFYSELDGAAVFGTSSSYGGSTSSLYNDVSGRGWICSYVRLDTLLLMK